MPFDSAETIIISMEIIKRKNDAMECKIVLVAFESMVSVQKYRKKIIRRNDNKRTTKKHIIKQ